MEKYPEKLKKRLIEYNTLKSVYESYKKFSTDINTINAYTILIDKCNQKIKLIEEELLKYG